MGDTNQRVVLITGCSSGIGLSTAVLLAKDENKRFKVYATMRNLAKKEALETEGRDVLGHNLFIEELDVTSEQQIKQVTEKIIERDGKIDILVNNAGVGCLRPADCETVDQIKVMFATNTIGPMLLTKTLLSHWEKRNTGHALVISSIAGIIGFPFSSSYSASKFAIEGYYEGLALECEGFNIKFTIIQPGLVKSKYKNSSSLASVVHYLDKTDAVTRMSLEKTLERYTKMLDSTFQTTEEIGHCVLKAITSEKPDFRLMTNKAFTSIVEQKYCNIYGNDGIRNIEEFFDCINNKGLEPIPTKEQVDTE